MLTRYFEHDLTLKTPQISIQHAVFSQYFPKIVLIFQKILDMFTNSKLFRDAGIYHIDLIPSVLNGAFHQL